MRLFDSLVALAATGHVMRFPGNAARSIGREANVIALLNGGKDWIARPATTRQT
jgi:hypothetical protein